MERAVYRIIDANFNRAREAVRVMEEYCRFALDCKPLTGRAKKLRHELCGILSEIDSAMLAASRDTLGDVGVGQTVENQLSRTNLKDCLIAACKRATEALRVIAEMLQTVDPAAANKIEELRYDAYTLEKDILITSATSEKFKDVRLYVIITSDLPADVISLAYRCVAGGADCIQLRAKEAGDDKLFAMAREFVQICRGGGVVSIINDRVDIAVAAGADGVHLGQNDLPIEQVRKLELSPLIVGKSTHSIEQLRLAVAEQPTYVALGPVFATETKPGAKQVGLRYVKEAKSELASTGIRSVAIGGISLENAAQVLAAGADAIVVCSAVTEAPDPTVACRVFKEKLTTFNNV